MIAKNRNQTIELLPQMASRHGLIAGATGSGKTITLKVLAEYFSSIGVPVFLSDVKGDLSGFAKSGAMSEKLAKRLKDNGFDVPDFSAFPVAFWDIYGKNGTHVRTTISEMGPHLLSRLLNLNDTQTQILQIVFKIADDTRLLLIDIKDLKSMLSYISENASELKGQYGNISVASLGSIQRGIIALEEAGGEMFFGEPALNIDDMIQTHNGKGVINILDATTLVNSSALYSTFLLWFLSELFENLPEVGDVDKPKFVFFFDEAHLLFDDTPKALIDKIEQVVRLIRSKGVGVYFVTQSPLDIPDDILRQLGNKFIHVIRAFTPADQKAIDAINKSFRQDGTLDVKKELSELGIGEAIVSVLDESGTPSVASMVFVAPPASSFSPLSADEINTIVKNSDIYAHYSKAIDRKSAYEQLSSTQSQESQAQTNQKSTTSDVMGTLFKSIARAAGSQIGREIIRGVLGTIIGGNTTRRRQK